MGIGTDNTRRFGHLGTPLWPHERCIGNDIEMCALDSLMTLLDLRTIVTVDCIASRADSKIWSYCRSYTSPLGCTVDSQYDCN